jgi:hypothetical protein
MELPARPFANSQASPRRRDGIAFRLRVSESCERPVRTRGVHVNPQPLPAIASRDPSAWDQALYAFLVEKGNRSGSRRTVESYGRML